MILIESLYMGPCYLLIGRFVDYFGGSWAIQWIVIVTGSPDRKHHEVK